MTPTPSGVPNEGRKNAENQTIGPGSVRGGGPEVYRFADFTLSIGEGRLSHAGHPVALAPKPFDTLVYLVRHAGRVVPKQELLDRVWAGTFVTDDVLVQAIGEVRRVLGDTPREPRFVETVPRRGYSFVAPLVVEQAPGAAEAASGAAGARVTPFPRPVAAPVATPTAKARRLAPRLWLASSVLVAVVGAAGIWVASRLPTGSVALDPGTVAVLPVHMVEPGEDRGWLPVGLDQILAHEIGQRSGARMVSPERIAAELAAAGFDDEPSLSPARALEVGRALRAEHVVRATFQRVGDRFTLGASLVAVRTGRVEREERVEGARADLLELVNALCVRIVRGLPAAAGGEEAVAPSPPPTRSLDAYTAYADALSLEARGGRDGLEAAEARLREAVRLDPDFARAYLKLALVQEARLRWGYGAADPVPAARAALDRAGRLSERDRLLVSGLARLVVGQDAAGAVEVWTRLLKLYPGYAEDAGVPLLVADALRGAREWGEVILATEAYADAQRLPEPDRAMLNGILATAFRRKGEYGRAIAYARRAVDLWPIKEGPAHLRMRSQLGRFLVDAGQPAEALEVFREVLEDPKADVVNVTDAAWGLYMAGDRSRATEGVERALRLDSGYGNAYHLRGWLKLTSGSYAEAARDLADAFRRTPIGFGSPEQGVIEGDVAALYYSGVALSKLGDRRGAQRAWREVVARASDALAGSRETPLNPVVRWQAESLVALASARLGQPVREPQPLAQDDALSRLQAARLYAVMGRLDESLAQLRQAISLGCGDFQHIRDDPNFEALRSRSDFNGLLAAFLGPSS